MPDCVHGPALHISRHVTAQAQLHVVSTRFDDTRAEALTAIATLPLIHQPPLLLHTSPNMAVADSLPSKQSTDMFFKGETGRNTRGLLRLIILVTIAAAAVASRLFSVIRFESIIHECQSIPTDHLVSLETKY